MVNREALTNSRGRLKTAERKFESAKEIYGTEVRRHPGSVLTHSQRCIEHCAKAVFLLMGVNAPNEHTIPVESEATKQLLNAVYADLGEDYAQKTARLIFLAELYGSAYPVSEYGVDVDRGTMEADDFLNRMEADQAYNHADAALTLTKQIINMAQGTMPPEE